MECANRNAFTLNTLQEGFALWRGISAKLGWELYVQEAQPTELLTRPRIVCENFTPVFSLSHYKNNTNAPKYLVSLEMYEEVGKTPPTYNLTS